MKKTPCPDCKGLFPDIVGPTHKYFGSSPGCWKIFGEILAKEYSCPEYMKVHRLTVDAYAVQHPGKPEPRTIQSLNVHLLALYLIFERGLDFQFATEAMGKAIENKKSQFTWLEPPTEPYPITNLDVLEAKDDIEHARIVWQWAETTWLCWKAHHETIRVLATEVL